MPRFNDPTKSPNPADDNDRDHPNRFDAASQEKAAIGPAIHRFRKLLADLSAASSTSNAATVTPIGLLSN